jgi:predicted DCC family thiol-disulfide oxidoreductase YuxK
MVQSAVHVASPPAKPLMIFDGDCHFCSLWIRRWKGVAGERVEFLPYQDPEIAARFPEIPREQFVSAVQLIQPDGAVHYGADAVFRTLALNPQCRRLSGAYRHSPAFARTAEFAYRFVARNRTLFSKLTRLLWGEHLESPTQLLVRWTFLRGLGLIYLIAFVSLWVQITGLMGRNGIWPVEATMRQVSEQVAAAKIDLNRYHLFPTLCWFNSSDYFLKVQCAAGTALAILLIFDLAPALCLVLLWVIYLSLSTVGGAFLSFQWDSLLLETGFLAIFFAPLQWLPRRPAREAPPSRIVLWLLRWLLFRLMFESGCVKLLSGDRTWRELTALRFHYETQPLPTWIGWYAHQLPAAIQTACVVLMFAIELGIPFLIFLPRRPRQFACAAFILLQLVIALTGNYCFFNLLTILLCLTLLDDAALGALLKRITPTREPVSPACPPRRQARWRVVFFLPVLVVTIGISVVQLFGTFGIRPPGPRPVLALYQWVMPLRSFNNYGLFAVMTTSRPEIVVEGSNDGIHWEPYEFNYKPGDLNRRPGFVAPHQPRLDWQMWFAAPGKYWENPWFENFCIRLLQGSPEVLALLRHNPFPDSPPRYIRATVYDYHFTDFETRHKTGAWWQRDAAEIYLPPVSLRENPDAAAPKAIRPRD